MADMGTLTPDQMLAQQQILRQQKMAEMLLQQGMQQPQGQMVSGRYVAPSIFQNLAGLANTYVGQRGIERAEQAQVDLAKRLRADETSAMADYFQQIQPKPAQPAPAGYELIDAGTPAIPANRQAALANLIANPKASPRLQNFAFNKMTADPEAFTLSADQSRFITTPDGNTKEIAKGILKPPTPTTEMQNFLFAKERGEIPQNMGFIGYQGYLKTVGKEQEKAPMGYRFMSDGSLEPIKGGPADLKTQAKSAGAGDVSLEIIKIKDSYDKLLEGGGITDPSLKIGSNIMGKISSSAAGQTLGSTFGTRNQTERDKIAQTRPLLMGAIMKATGMSAKQIDSNAELKLWLSTATDPNKSYEANIAALKNIEDLYGVTALDKQVNAPNFKTPPTIPIPPNSNKTVVKTGTVQDGPNKGKKIVQYSDGTTEYK